MQRSTLSLLLDSDQNGYSHSLYIIVDLVDPPRTHDDCFDSYFLLQRKRGQTRGSPQTALMLDVKTRCWSLTPQVGTLGGGPVFDRPCCKLPEGYTVDLP